MAGSEGWIVSFVFSSLNVDMKMETGIGMMEARGLGYVCRCAGVYSEVDIMYCSIKANCAKLSCV